MAIPTHFEQETMVWKGPTKDIGDMPAYREPQENLSISCWQLDEEELKEVATTGVVWLYVWGIHPPVAVQAQNPWEEK